MNVDTSRPEVVATRMATGGALQGVLMGLTRMHNGRVIYFDTLRLDNEWTEIDFDTDQLEAGIHQLTLFDTEGHVWAERLFLSIPTASQPQAHSPWPLPTKPLRPIKT